MAHDRKAVDELLTRAVGHAMNVWYTLNCMSGLHREEKDDTFWRRMPELILHLQHLGCALDEAYRHMSPKNLPAPTKGELPN